MTAARPLGERIRSICESLESHGPQNIEQLREKFRDIEYSNLWKYANRAVSLGVITVSTDEGRRKFEIVPGWMETMVARKPAKQPKPQSVPIKYTGPILTRWVGAMIHMNEVRQ